MISRRDALMLGAAGFLVPSLEVFATTATPEATPGATPVASGSTRGSWPMESGNPARSGVMPGPIPSLEMPVIVRWRFDPENDWLQDEEPVMADGVIYARGGSNIYAINVDSGLEYWRFELPETSHLTIADGVLYATTYGGTLHAISTDTGLEVWRYGDGSGQGTPGSGSSELQSPAVVDGMVILTGAGMVAGLNANTGEPVWQTSLEVWPVRPVVANALVLGAGNEGVIAWDIVTGEERWRSSTALAAVAAVGTSVVTGGEDYLSGLDLATGQELWRYTMLGESPAGAWSETLVLLVVLTMDDSGSSTGELQAISTETGGLHWMYSLGRVGSDVKMRLVGDLAFVYIDEPESRLVAIDTTSGLETWDFRGYVTDVNPIAVDNYLYFVHDDQLFAIGNLLDPVLMTDVTLRAAPAESGLERGTARAGDAIVSIGARADTNGQLWVEVNIGGVMGWIPASAIDPATLPPEGEPWVIYDPEWF